MKSEGTSKVTWEIEPVGDSCRLTVTHDQLREGANDELYGGWPMILSGLKTWLETGELLTTPGSLMYSRSHVDDRRPMSSGGARRQNSKEDETSAPRRDTQTMATYVLIHGAGSDSWYWHLVAPRAARPWPRRRRGRPAVRRRRRRAVGVRRRRRRRDRRPHATSCSSPSRWPVSPRRWCANACRSTCMVLVAAMVPSPGESPGDWWANTGWEQAKREQARARGPATDDRRPRGDCSSTTCRPTWWPTAMTQGAGPVGHAVREAVAALGVARRADGVPALPRRPLLPRRVPAARRRGTSGHHARRDGRRPPARARTPGRAGRAPRGISDRGRDRERNDTMTRTEPAGAIDARYSSEGAAATHGTRRDANSTKPACTGSRRCAPTAART